MKVHVVSLKAKEREALNGLLHKGSHPAVVIQRAQILLKADKQLKDKTIAEHLDCTPEHVARVRQRYCKHSLRRALFDADRSGRPVIFQAKEKANIVALACTKAPKGFGGWTIDLLVQKIREREKIKIGRTKVWTILKENELKPWREKNVVHSKAQQGI